jgi:cytidylate kinase
MIIAIDGPAASGKGTLAKRLAEHYGLGHLDSGLLYRAVAHAVEASGAALTDAAAAAAAARRLDARRLNDADLRGRGWGEAASVVAAFPAVREALLGLQRAFAGRAGGAVIDGRDIGTVICPAADVKLFVTAAPEVRAERRYREMLGRGEPAALDAILKDILARDARDSGRAVSPLAAAADAIVLDTSALSPDAAFEAARRIVETRRPQLATS